MGTALAVIVVVLVPILVVVVRRLRGRTRSREAPATPARPTVSSTVGLRLGRMTRSDDRPRQLTIADGAIVAVALSLIVIATGLALWQLHFTEADHVQPQGVAVVAPERNAPGKGFFVAMGVRVPSCENPVDVTLVTDGSAEYWLGRRETSRTMVRVAIPDRNLHDLRAGLGGDGVEGLVEPLTQTRPNAERVRIAGIKRLRSVTRLRIEVPGWQNHLRPLVVSFKADWLSKRSIGTCFLRLPALAGPATVLSAQDARERAVSRVGPTGEDIVRNDDIELEAPYEDWLETSLALTTVRAGENSVRGDISEPAPDQQVNGLPTWTCATQPVVKYTDLATRGLSSPDELLGATNDRAGVPSVRRLAGEYRSRSCAATVVVEEPSASLLRDAWLLAIGALLSLGITLLIEFGLERLRPARRDALGPSR
jgi:hypothetical protein